MLTPKCLGRNKGSTLANCMDAARGGYFERVPKGGPKSGYPAEAWYHYTDETCDYGCMVTEYIYWALTSILGTQDFPGRHEALEVEWELNTRERVRTKDAAVYELLTDPQYRCPIKKHPMETTNHRHFPSQLFLSFLSKMKINRGNSPY